MHGAGMLGDSAHIEMLRRKIRKEEIDRVGSPQDKKEVQPYKYTH